MSENLDPRYPASFQRGHSGSTASPARTSPPSASPSHPESSVSRGEAATADASRLTPELKTGAVAPSDGEIEAGRFNPFIGGLWVVSLGMAVGGAWLSVWQTLQQFASYRGPSSTPMLDAILPQLSYFLSGPAITAGLLGIIGLLFWHAFAWRRRAIARLAAESAPRD